jgi:hypothetical protein
MKKFILSLIVAGFAMTASAQNFTFNPAKPVITVSTLKTAGELVIYIKNTATTKQTLKWNLFGVTAPNQDYTLTICDNLNCYAQSQLSSEQTMGEINAGDSGFFKVDFTPNSAINKGKGNITLSVNDGSKSKTLDITISYTGNTNSIESINYTDAFNLIDRINNCTIFINPNISSKVNIVSVYNLAGQCVFTATNPMNVIELPTDLKGMFIIRGATQDGRTSINKIELR